jgi:hypothetical protein
MRPGSSRAIQPKTQSDRRTAQLFRRTVFDSSLTGSPGGAFEIVLNRARL